VTATLPEEVGSPHRALAPIVNRKNRITGCNALSRPQPEFRPFEAIDHIGLSLEKCQLILKVPRAGAILARGFSYHMISQASEFVLFEQGSALLIPEITPFRAGKHESHSNFLRPSSSKETFHTNFDPMTR
jgi:hypothetical protein